MKKLSIVLLLIILSQTSHAQKCGSIRNLELIRNNNPSLYSSIMAIENQTKTFLKAQTLNSLATQTLIHIPVVVHVLYSNSEQNITDDQIKSQIEVLNEDYRRLNADRTNTPTAFTTVAADVNIDFFLSCIDPVGNPTNGITRTQTSINPFNCVRNVDGSINETSTRIKYTSTGGHDAWPSDRYLNIWVCNLASPLLGYTQFPGFGTAATDGVVIKYNAFGRRGTLDATYNKGRTATHEIGHWLNLIHIWGDDDNGDEICTNNECTGSDFVDDTPNQGEENYGVPSFPHTDCCSPLSPGVMFMNYMDYTDDACMNLFTTGQVNRMRALFSPGGARECFAINPSIYLYCNALMTLSGPTPVCSSGSTFTVNNLPSGCTVSWTNSTNLTIASTSGNTAVFTSNENGLGWVQATINNCSSVALPQFNVWAGVPTVSSETPLAYFDSNTYNNACNLKTTSTYMDIGGASSVIWDRIAASPSTTTWNQSGNNINFYFYQVNQTAVFRISAINGCGETTNDFGFKSVTCGGGGGGCNAVYTLSPNPTSGSIKITPQIPAPCNVVSTSSLASTATNKSGFVAVYDQQGTLKKQFHYSYNSELEIDLSNFKNGIYLIEIYDGNTIDKKTIILQH